MRAFLKTVGSPLRRPSAARNDSSRDDGPVTASFRDPAEVAKIWSSIQTSIAAGRISESKSDHGSDITSDRHSEPLHHLKAQTDKLVQILVQESTLSSSDLTGPCLEHIITHDILGDLVKLALPDEPIGVLPIVLQSVDSLVSKLENDFVALAHRPLLLLLRGCAAPSGLSPNATPAASSTASLPEQLGRASSANGTAEGLVKQAPSDGSNRYPVQLASLLCSICSRIVQNPVFLPIFFQDRQTKSQEAAEELLKAEVLHSSTSEQRLVTNLRSDRSSNQWITTSEADRTSNKGHWMNTPYHFPVFTMLLALMHAEGQAGDFARQGILFIVDLAATLSTDLTAKPDQNPFRHSNNHSRPLSRQDGRQSGHQHRDSVEQTTVGALTSLSTYITQSSFAEVLGAGLGASYGLLPRKLYITSRTELDGVSSQSLTAAPGTTAETLSEQEAAVLGFTLDTDAEYIRLRELWLRLIEFVQDVLQRVQQAERAGDVEELSFVYSWTDDLFSSNDSSRSVSSLSYLQRKLLYTIKTAFLDNALGPTLDEVVVATSPLSPLFSKTSHLDNMACHVAVLLHLQVMVDALLPESLLGKIVIRYLLDGRDLDNVQGKHESITHDASGILFDATSPPIGLLSTSGGAGSNRMKRRRTNEILLPSTAPGPQSGTPTSNTHGMADTHALSFRLKDILLSHITLSPPAPQYTDSAPQTKALALQLLDTLLQRFDVESLDLLDIIPDVHATRFPFIVTPSGTECGYSEEDEESFVYPASESASSESTFVYPECPVQDDIAPKPDETYHEEVLPSSEVEVLFRLLRSTTIISIAEQALTVQSRTKDGGCNTTFSSYLHDAEMAVLSDSAFRRGCALIELANLQVGQSDGTAHTPPSLAGNKVSPTARQDQNGSNVRSIIHDHDHDPMVVHRLSTSSSIVAALSSSLCHFFSNSTNVNQHLISCISRLAKCPYRSLSGWLIPSGVSPLAQLQKMGFVEALRSEPTELDRAESATQDVRPSKTSSLLSFISPSKQKAYNTSENSRGSGLSHKIKSDSRMRRASVPGDAIVFDILAQLINHTDTYRSSVKHFSSHLAERRKCLAFMDELAEALGTDAPPVSSHPATHKSHGITSPVLAFAGNLGSRNAGKDGSSPYAAHYTATSGVQVPVYVAEMPSSSALQETEFSSTNQPQLTSLSTLLDNVIILEEAVKEIMALVVIRKSLGIDAVGI